MNALAFLTRGRFARSVRTILASDIAVALDAEVSIELGMGSPIVDMEVEDVGLLEVEVEPSSVDISALGSETVIEVD